MKYIWKMLQSHISEAFLSAIPYQGSPRPSLKQGEQPRSKTRYGWGAKCVFLVGLGFVFLFLKARNGGWDWMKNVRQGQHF